MDRLDRAALDRDMARLASGDRSAFEAVYRVAAPAVTRLTRRLLSGSSEAEDTAQQALIKVFERASDYDPERPALPWILGIAAWQCRTARQKRRRRRESLLPEALVSEGSDPERWVVAADLDAALHDVMGSLRPSDVATLAVAMGYAPRPDDVPAATFRKRLQRAMERLRAAWRAQHG